MSIFQSTHQNFLQFLNELDFRCKRNGVKRGISQIIYSSVIEGAALFLVVWCVYLYLKPQGMGWIGLLIGSALAPALFNLVWQELRFEQRVKKIEQQLPDSLILFASLPTHVTFEHAIETLATSTAEPIRTEWKRVHQSMQKSGNATNALEKFGEGMQSPNIAACIHLFQRGYESGINIHASTASLAHELLLFHSYFQERNATLMVEKYTLLLAGGIMVPVLLGVMVGVVQKLPLNLLLENADAHRALFDAALFSIRGYLGIYAALAGIFVGLQENQCWKMSVYVLVLIPLAQLAYQLGKWWTG